jgi:hypothetical protein
MGPRFPDTQLEAAGRKGSVGRSKQIRDESAATSTVRAEDLVNLIREALYDEVSKREVARVLQLILVDKDGPALVEYANSPVQTDPQEARYLNELDQA